MNNKKKNIIFIGLLTVLPAILCFDRLNNAIDDAFISLRYVWNILNGFGPVFNPGERLEAISNPTWIWLITGISYISNISNPSSLYFLSIVLGVFIFIISGIIFFFFLKSFLKNENYAFILALIFALNPYIAFYAANGMENAFVYFLLIIILFFSWKYLQNKKTLWMILVGILLGILSISRPEGIIYIISYFISIGLIKFSKDYNLKKKDFIISFSISLLIFLLFELWRWTYYGELVSNTVYAKNNFSLSIIKESFKYLTIFFVYGIGLFIPYFFVFGKFSLKGLDINRKVILSLVTVLFFVHTAFVFYAGGDWMPGLRLMLFTIPCFIILLSILTRDSISQLSNVKWFYIAILFSISANIYIGRDKLRPIQSGFNLKQYKNYYYEKINLANKLKEISTPGEKVLVNDIGYISFFNPQLKFVDLYGLADKHIAKDVKGKHFQRSAPDYLMNLNFDYFVIIENNWNSDLNTYDSSKTYHQTSINDFIKHKDFSLKFKPVYILKEGTIYKNISSGK